MGKIYGTATFKYMAESKDVLICLNMEENVIEIQYGNEVHCSMDNLQACQEAFLGLSSCQTGSLTNIQLFTPTGILKKNLWDDFIITKFEPGTISIYDCALSRILNIPENNLGITKFALHTKKSSLVDFTLEPFDECTPQFELCFSGFQRELGNHLVLDSKYGKIKVQGENSRIIAIGENSFFEGMEIIQCVLGVLQGGPVTLRSSLENKTLKINLANHQGGGLGPLYKNPKDIQPMAQAIFNFLTSLDEADWEIWRRALYYLLHGFSGNCLLEVKTISLFTFMEIIQGAGALCKNWMVQELDISSDEAGVLVETRNKLIHNGASIGEAVLASKQCNKKPEFESWNGFNDFIDLCNSGKTGVRFYFTLVKILNRYLLKKAGYNGDWNDYSSYGCWD